MVDSSDTDKNSISSSIHDLDNELVGRTLDGKYKVIERLGGGGMGVVYRGVHSAIDRTVALKVLRANTVAAGEEFEKFLARFRQEARASSRIQHPHAIAVYDFGIFEGYPYLVMQYVAGISLKEFQKKRGALPLSLVQSILTQIGGALSEAHRQDIVHRDLKPDNIMIEEKGDSVHAYVLDFGIAKICGASSSGEIALTQVGTIVGTPQYMSPEQVRSQQVDARSDVYSLGIMLYEMLSGEVPFTSDSAIGILMKHVSEIPVPVRKLRPELAIPASIEVAIMRALEKDPANRPQSIQQLVNEFCQAEPSPRASSSLLTAIPWANRAGSNSKSKQFFGIGILLAAIAAGGLFWLMPDGKPGAASSAVAAGGTTTVVTGSIVNGSDDIIVANIPNSSVPKSSDSNSSAPNSNATASISASTQPKQSPTAAALRNLEEETEIVVEKSGSQSNTADETSSASAGAGSVAPLTGVALEYFQRGTAAYRAQDFSQARDWFEQALKLAPEDPEVLRNLAEAHLSLEKYVDATVLLERSIAVDPTEVKSHASLGFAFDQLGRLEDATKAYRKSIELRPDYAVAHNNLGFALLRLKQFSEAEQALLQAIKLDPKYVRAFYNAGDLYLAQSKFDKAIEYHQLATKLDSGNAKAFNKLGDTLARAGRDADAKNAYGQALKIDPTLQEARQALDELP